MHERNKNLVVRLDATELDMVHAVANAQDTPISQVIRRFIRDSYGALYGAAKPKPHTSPKTAATK